MEQLLTIQQLYAGLLVFRLICWQSVRMAKKLEIKPCAWYAAPMHMLFSRLVFLRLRLALTLLGLAGLAACAGSGSAPAQTNSAFGNKSGVEVYGVIDVGYGHSSSQVKTSK